VAQPAITLVLGGQRSGKSRYAEGLVAAHAGPLVYVATATAGDGEMTERIETHRRRRGPRWRTVEEPLDVPAVLSRERTVGNAVLIDCLTIWLSNLMGAGRDVAAETGRLVAGLGEGAGPIVLVSNEVGSGIIPDSALARAYADALGTLNQRVAAAADRVVLMAAGLPLVLKPNPAME
jgi:adenosylcobinamide kinase/adenosylcobinamide-phosphate guanylyltransferase